MRRAQVDRVRARRRVLQARGPADRVRRRARGWGGARRRDALDLQLAHPVGREEDLRGVHGSAHVEPAVVGRVLLVQLRAHGTRARAVLVQVRHVRYFRRVKRDPVLRRMRPGPRAARRSVVLDQFTSRRTRSPLCNAESPRCTPPCAGATHISVYDVGSTRSAMPLCMGRTWYHVSTD